MDNRAHIDIEFTVYGKSFKTQFSINWQAGDGIDRRVAEWFSNRYQEAYDAFYADRHIAEERQRAKQVERRERGELARLKSKYEVGEQR